MLLVLAVSGVAAAILQLAWSRPIALLLGAGADSRASALAVALAGLAIGALLGGQLAPRLRRPLLAVAIAHGVIAACGLALPSLLAVTGGAALALASIATIALGTTVPLLGRVAGPRIAAACAAGLGGAALGVAITVRWALGAIGVAGSSRVGGAIALIAAAIAAAIGRRDLEAAAPAPASAPRAPLALAAVAGAAIAMAHLLYGRALALTFHNSLHTAATIDVALLVALGLGAALAARLAARPPGAVIAVASAAAAIAVPLSIATLWAVTRLGYFTVGGGLAGYLAAGLGLALAVLGPPMLATAVLVPTAWRWRGAVAEVLAVAALAAALATVLTTRVILPTLGLWGGLTALSALLAIAAVAAASRAGSRARVAAAVACATALGGGLLARPTPPMRPGEQVVARWETADGRVEVVEAPGRRRLRVDLHDGRGSSDQRVRLRRLGHLPVLLHPAPRRVLHLGLGTGIAAGAALGHGGVEQLDVVEPIPAIVEAARWFAEWNGRALDDSRIRVHHADPRRWLAASASRWDVIVSEPRSPWSRGVGAGYAVEQQRAIAAHLTPGGVHLQWLALWQLGERDLARIADATAAAFAHVALWRGDTSRRWGMIAVVASDQPLVLDGVALRARIAAVTPAVALDDGWADPAAMLMLYAGDWPQRPGAALHGDDRPLLDLEAPATQRDGTALTAARLVRFYREVIAQLPRDAVHFTPAPGEPAWDPVAGLELQMGAAGADGEPAE